MFFELGGLPSAFFEKLDLFLTLLPERVSYRWIAKATDTWT